MPHLYWSRHGEVACADHVPAKDSTRWETDAWSAIRPQLEAQFQCEQCHSAVPDARRVSSRARQPLVLNVDDRPFNLYTRDRILRRAGFSVANEESGAKTCEIAGRLRPDLILLDVHLGDADGRELCQQIKADPDLAGVPVVLISSTLAGHVDELETVRWAKADAFVAEPVDPEALVALLVKTIGDKPNGSTPG
jgi:CheY-like chemotaxis protein